MMLVLRTIRQILLYVTYIASMSVFAGSYLYHGCYHYSALVFFYGNVIIDPNMTVNMCLNKCRSTTFTHVALQQKNQCFCANLTREVQGNCPFFCSGNISERCGGANGSFSVYSKVTQSSTESISDVSTSTPTIQGSSQGPTISKSDVSASTPTIQDTSQGPTSSSSDVSASTPTIHGTSQCPTTSSSDVSASTPTIHDTSQKLTTTSPITDTGTDQGQAATTSANDCLCNCDEMRDIISWGSLTQDEQKKMMDTILVDFRVKIENLSSTIRRKSSAKDKRTEAAAIGYVGITILAVALGFLVTPDFISLFRYMLVLIKRKWLDRH